MTDRTIPSASWTPPDTGRRRSGPQRPDGISLYPMPDGPKLFDVLTADQESSVGLNRDFPSPSGGGSGGSSGAVGQMWPADDLA
jgi:hypothetical protein